LQGIFDVILYQSLLAIWTLTGRSRWNGRSRFPQQNFSQFSSHQM